MNFLKILEFQCSCLQIKRDASLVIDDFYQDIEKAGLISQITTNLYIFARCIDYSMFFLDN